MKKILIIGKGGRENALAKAFSKSCKVFVAPGNSGMKNIASLVNIEENDFESLIKFAKEEKIDLTFVGPEGPLSNGIVDEFTKNNLLIFGPNKNAAKIESSKDFAKKLMKKYNIPTANYETFTNLEEALHYIKNKKAPYVLKADGLVAGKGVIIAKDLNEAENALKDMLEGNKFGDAGSKVIIEDFLEGFEFSFMALVNGEKVYPLELARDYKKALSGDLGENTGGMGAYSPVPQITSDCINISIKEILQKTANAMVMEGAPFVGVLYAGLINTNEGPKVIEFNARFGDPETEVLMPRLSSDIYEFTMAVLNKEEFVPKWEDNFCIGVVLASKGYPNSYETGFDITIGNEDSVYYCGVSGDYPLKTDGGRVLVVTSKGSSLIEARESVYKKIKNINFKNMYFREDIGYFK